jgi:branched-chain amino acid transport system substrate-binding protein
VAPPPVVGAAPPPGAPAPEETAPAGDLAPPVPPATEKLRIALLLPLSGPNAALGGALLDAAQMALYDVADGRVELLPHDTQGRPDVAADAARIAVGEGARIVIGPLLAAEVEAVKPITHAASVPVLAFSTATQLAGDGTYLMGFLPRQEIERVAAFAHSKGVARFAVLAPRSPYGEIAVAALRAAVEQDGAALEHVEYYDPAAQDLSHVVQHLAGVKVDPAVAKKQQKLAASSNAAPPREPPPLDFDAVLLPEGAQRLKSVAPLLPYYDVDPEKVHFLGTGLWDEPGLGSEPALSGGWYAAPPPEARARFEARFREIYGHQAPRLATLGYDATALAAVLARSADFSATALTNPSGFAGVDGIFRLLPDGLIQRGLAVLEVHRNGNTVVDPAPTTFQSATE